MKVTCSEGVRWLGEGGMELRVLALRRGPAVYLLRRCCSRSSAVALPCAVAVPCPYFPIFEGSGLEFEGVEAVTPVVETVEVAALAEKEVDVPATELELLLLLRLEFKTVMFLVSVGAEMARSGGPLAREVEGDAEALLVEADDEEATMVCAFGSSLL